MKYKQTHGFTLIELMIVIVIIGILTAIAYPAYQNKMIETRRSDGHAKLLEIMHAQERNYTSSMTYVADLTNLGYASDPVDSEEGHYQISAAACPSSTIGTCVRLTATPIGRQLSDGALTFDSTGQKLPANKW